MLVFASLVAATTSNPNVAQYSFVSIGDWGGHDLQESTYTKNTEDVCRDKQDGHMLTNPHTWTLGCETAEVKRRRARCSFRYRHWRQFLLVRHHEHERLSGTRGHVLLDTFVHVNDYLFDIVV